MPLRVIQQFISQCGECPNLSYYSGGMYECRISGSRVDQGSKDYLIMSDCPLPYAGPPVPKVHFHKESDNLDADQS